MADAKVTPLMRQYNEIKAKYPDTILLFRVGDFYETFGEDAVLTSKTLNIVLTTRAGDKLAGFPYHAMDTYLPKFLKSGLRVAVCEQLEDPKFAKGVVKRGVTEIVTPSLSYNEKTSDASQNSYLAAIYYEKDSVGIALTDIMTGEFYVAQGSKIEMEKLLQSFMPKEVIVPKQEMRAFEQSFGDDFCLKTYEDWVFTMDFAKDTVFNHFEVNSFKGFGVDDMPLGVIAVGSVLHYMRETQHTSLSHIRTISRLDNLNYLWLDKFTVRNLELIVPTNEKGKTLLGILNRTQSNMGSRLMQRWLLLPLIDKQAIERRHNIVQGFLRSGTLAHNVRESIRAVGDLERMVSKLAFMRTQPNELNALKNSLNEIAKIKNNISLSSNKELKIYEALDECPSLIALLDKNLDAEAPNNIAKCNAIAAGVNEELDSLRQIAYHGKDYLADLQSRESLATGITSLKVGFNNVFGYYIEVTNPHKDKVPSSWVRKQTLTNAERYITAELKEYEDKILMAEGRIAELEGTLYRQLLEQCGAFIETLQSDAQILAEMDCLLSFAQIAEENNYVKPKINEGKTLRIVEGRHPVIEKMLPVGESYVANDVYLDTDKQQICIITGPNMSGKSAYLRQTALIVLMAQIGSFVPAKSAEIGIVDKIFTRVGASDNISSGESTFMVEMNETASILNNLSDRSLVLLDEIGRGTSTYDGVSIAWAIASFLHNNSRSNKCRAKVLFATHYHELIEMENQYERIKNYHVSVKEIGDRIIFLRKIVKGGSSQSFGIHVAQLAGMPNEVITQAEALLAELDQKNKKNNSSNLKKATKIADNNYQLSFIQLEDPLLLDIKQEILSTDIDNLTPVEALLKLSHIKKIIEKL
ncbi:MAG: DNA mismatch repair protein MutS [Bacteroidales bacterium]|jgi:DNA mismatch repair protein MutS|nr:DNA mismatch repair protein MutS [Bacteroidales bacterium]